MDVDEIYSSLGKPGRYQICVYILLGFNYIPVVTNHLAMAFYGAKIPHYCKVPENLTSVEYIPHVYNPTLNTTSYDSCQVYQNFTDVNDNSTTMCQNGWTYNPVYGERTIVNHFDLVCDRAHLSSIATTIYFAGVMIGGLIFGSLSDRFGRKPFMLTTLYSHIIVGVALAFADTYLLFVLLRFVQGVLMQGLQTCTFVLAMELFTPAHRTFVGAGVEIFWGVGVMWLALLSWFLKDWAKVQLAITLPSVLTVAYIWLIPESVRWLVANKKYKQASAVVKKAAKFNNVSIPDHLLTASKEQNLLLTTKEMTVVVQNGLTEHEIVQTRDESSDNEKNKGKRYTVLDMFKTRRLCQRSFILFYLWFAVTVGYYGLSFSLSVLYGNKYLNVFIGGAVELVAYIIALFVLNRFGRRRPLAMYLLVGGVLCIAAGAIPSRTGSGTDLGVYKTVLAVLGRFGLAGGFSVIFLFTSELYPTVIRNVSIGACAFWMRVGGVLVPQILLLGQYTFKSLPIILLGCFALLGSGLTLLLPETLNRKLPDTVAEAEGIRKSTTTKKSRHKSSDNGVNTGEKIGLENDLESRS